MTWHCTSQEIPDFISQTIRSSPCKLEHSPYAGCVLLGMLKAVEVELLKRDMLGPDAPQATPLWFIAETERNVFLWRNGKSIGDYGRYSFWIDLKALIQKRRVQLSRNKGFNPFIQSSAPLGVSSGTPTPRRDAAPDSESRYLDLIEELSDTIFKRAETLSHASESIRIELSPHGLSRTPVMLPRRKEGQRSSGERQ